MGFYFRKSVGFGPLRLNFSKSGVGCSLGVRGARIGTGPRGPYVAGGRYGLYYRQYLGHPQSEDAGKVVGHEGGIHWGWITFLLALMLVFMVLRILF